MNKLLVKFRQFLRKRQLNYLISEVPYLRVYRDGCVIYSGDKTRMDYSDVSHSMVELGSGCLGQIECPETSSGYPTFVSTGRPFAINHLEELAYCTAVSSTLHGLWRLQDAPRKSNATVRRK